MTTFETSTLSGDELHAAALAKAGGGELSRNDVYEIAEAAGHFSHRTDDGTMRGSETYYCARITDERWVTAPDPVTATLRAYLLA